MIIIGYQGIGKSTLANRRTMRCIDLESGNFFVDGKRADDWYKIYVQIAKHLSQQGYTVFVSSHKVVRDELYGCGVPVAACFPDLSLKDEWVAKLEARYAESKLDKDYRALMNAKECYTTNISEMIADCDEYGYEKIVITDIEHPDLSHWLLDVI